MYNMYEMYEMYKTYEESVRKYKTDRRYPSQYGFHNRARSRQLAGDLSFWCRERRGAYIGSSTPLKTEQYLISTSLSSDTLNLQWPRIAEVLLVTSDRFHP